jgi:hypothetical protein
MVKVMLISIFFPKTLNSQLLYIPNNKAKTLCYEAKELSDKDEKKLIKAIDIDSNFILPYAMLGQLKMNKRDLISEKGAIYYYSKFLEKEKLYPIDINNNKFKPVEVKKNRIECLIAANKFSSECFKSSKNVSCVYSLDELSSFINSSIEDFSSLEDYYEKDFKKRVFFDLHSLKGEIDFKIGDFASSAQTYKYIISKLENDNKSKLVVYDKLYSMFLEIGDKESAKNALSEYVTIYSQNFSSSIDYLEKKQRLISLINELNNLSSNDYTICNINGKDVFCENHNIAVENFSSALQFWNYYILNQNAISNEYTKFRESKGHYGRWFQKFNLKYVHIIYQFYLEIGKGQGMVWPKFKPLKLKGEHLFEEGEIQDKFQSILRDFIKCDCLPMIYDLNDRTMQVIASSKKDSTLTPMITLSNDWRMYNQLSINYYNSKSEIATKTSSGIELGKQYTCEKLYQIEKQNYENQQALIRAQQLQQEAEARRLQQEQNYKETQLRLIEEENTRKQKEIDLVNAKNQQIEKKKELENQKAANEFMKYMFQSAGSSSSSGSNSGSDSHQSSKKCKWCSEAFSGDGFQYTKSTSGSCSVTENSIGEYHSRNCATAACQAEH